MSSEADSKSPVKTAGARPAPPTTPLTTSLGQNKAGKGTPAGGGGAPTATMKRVIDAQGWTSELAQDLSLWFVSVLGSGSAMNDVVTAEDFFDRLQTGVELCDLINKIAPDHAIASIARDAKPKSYQAYDNIQSFLDAAKKIGVHDLSIFVVDDLIQRKSDKLVVNTLLQLSDLCASEKNNIPRAAIREEVRRAFASPLKKATAGSAGAASTAVGAGTASDSATHGGSHEKKPSGTTYTAVGAGVASSYAAVGTSAAGGNTDSAAAGAAPAAATDSKREGKSSDPAAVSQLGADGEDSDNGQSDDEDDDGAAGGAGSGSGDADAAARRARREARRAERRAARERGGGGGGCHKCCKREPDWQNPDKMFFGFLLFATHAVAYYLKRRSGK